MALERDVRARDEKSRDEKSGDGGARLDVFRAARATVHALEQLAGGFGTGVLALLVLLLVIAVAALSLVGVGLLLVPAVLRAVHAVAERERVRLSRWGPEVISPEPGPVRLRAALADPGTRRELRWLLGHGTLGLLIGFVAILLPLYALQDLSFLFWWQQVPPGETSSASFVWVVDDWAGAFAVALMGLGWGAITVGFTPLMARWQARPGRRLLAPGRETDLSLRITQLTATRAAALDAHAVELRRIERSLHDGAQNRLVAVTVLLGAARRMVERDPAGAQELLERAQSAAELALGELRAVVRTILPPVLDRGLAGALNGLAVACPVPCRVEVDAEVRCAASVEATAYYVVAEALTNISRHSHAEHATVQVQTRGGRLFVRVSDDGRGGADASRGSGLEGIRRRVEALDGTLLLTSPLGGPTTLDLELPCGS